MSSDSVSPRTATTEADARRCYPALQELHRRLDEQMFLRRWKKQTAAGFEVVYIESDDEVAAAAGFWTMTTMAFGRILYLEDLVVLPPHRGRGYGSQLLRHLQTETVARGCSSLHLDSGYERHDAHRSYLAHGFRLASHHLAWTPADDARPNRGPTSPSDTFSAPGPNLDASTQTRWSSERSNSSAACQSD